MKKIIFSIATLLFCSSVGAQTLLEQYRQKALEYNHDLKAAQKNIQASIDLESSAKADFAPKLSAGANFQYLGNPMEISKDIPSLGKINISGQHLNYGASATLMQPIYTGGRLVESLRMAELNRSMSQSEEQLVRSAVCYQTDMQYWSTVARAEMVSIAREMCASTESLVRTIRERVEAGLVDPQQLLMAEVKMNEAQYQLLRAESDFATGRMALNSLLGVALENPTAVDSLVPMVSDAASLINATKERPEVAIARDNIGMAESSLKLSDSKYKPQFFAGADGNYSSPGYNFKPNIDPNYALYAKISIPILEWGKRKSDKRAASQRVGMANDRLNKTYDAVELERQSAWVSLNKSIAQVDLSRSSLEKAFENERQAMERYSEGKISVLEVIDSQSYRQRSQINYAEARVSAQINYSNLVRAVNGY